MTTLHLTAGNMYGGIESFLGTIARQSSATPEVQHQFVCCFSGRLEEELRQNQARVLRLPSPRMSRPWSIFRARETLGSILDANNFTSVISHASWTHSLFGGVVKSRGLPLVHWIHGLATPATWLERLAARTRPSHIVANSEFTWQLARRLFPCSPGSVIYCPVESKPASAGARERLRTEHGTPKGSAVIVQVSRMDEYKGHGLHLEALSRLAGVEGWECWFVGAAQSEIERSFERSLRERARALGIAGRIRFLGQRKDVRDVLAAADIFCQPNIGPEPFGIVFIEALAAGLPVVSTRMGGAMEIVTGDCGRLTPPGDAEALAADLRRLIQDVALRQSLGKSGPARANELCNPSEQMHKIAILLQSLTHNAR
jgi:glycosyltransferase involved in cell wall biosynthesis